MSSRRWLLEPGRRVSLDRWDSGDVSGAGAKGKSAGKRELRKQSGRLGELQELLFAEHKHGLLIVLQGMDTSGKDGLVRHVFWAVSPQGARVASFKRPSEQELDHDYLWRVHAQAPAKGEIVIFNRSHYEDVLVPRVHGTITRRECEARFRQINAFEQTLCEEGATLLKLFLHVGKETQRARLKDRLDDPRKHWKFDYGDLRERALWGSYMRAYEDLLSATSTRHAPWHLVPADHKWARNLIAARLVIGALERLKMRYPQPKKELAGIELD